VAGEGRRLDELCRLYAAVEAGDVEAIRALAMRLAAESHQTPPRPGCDVVDEALRIISGLAP